ALRGLLRFCQDSTIWAGNRYAHAGLVALVSDGWLTDPSLIRLMRMTLGAAPTGRVGPPALTPLSESFITAVPSIYPELSWLFG
ncbi:hypothetical protein ACQCQN_19360, partial [Ralstonia pseudosolanacearum]